MSVHGKYCMAQTDHPFGGKTALGKVSVLKGVRVPPTVGWRGRESPLSGAVAPVLLTFSKRAASRICA